MRLARLATPIALLSLALAGCGGGSKVAVQEVPGGVANITVPGGDALAPQATATATATATPTTTPTSGTASTTTTTPQSQTTQSQTQTTPQQTTPQQTTPQSSAGGGATAPDAATPAPGSDKQQFEAFCQQNPGAC